MNVTAVDRGISIFMIFFLFIFFSNYDSKHDVLKIFPDSKK